MNKRDFIKSGLGLAGLSLLNPLESLDSLGATASFTLPPLPFAYDALEPMLDARTMDIHYNRHHASYVEKLNAEVTTSKVVFKSLEDLLRNQAHLNKTIRNQGGGHFNHSLLWRTMCKPSSVKMPLELEMELIMHFDSVEDFLSSFRFTAISRPGSGWVWLCKSEEGKLFITSTPNQDNPLMKIEGLVQGKPLLGIDVWEHAYYLKYFNKRTEYIDAFVSCINWEEVERIRKEK